MFKKSPPTSHNILPYFAKQNAPSLGTSWCVLGAQLIHVTVQVLFTHEISIRGEATLHALDEGEMLAGPGGQSASSKYPVAN